MQQSPDRKHPHRLPDEVYETQRSPIFLTIAVKGDQKLIAPRLAPMVVAVLGERAMRFGLRLHAYCLMSNHIHIVCAVKSRQSSLRSFIAAFKSEVSRRAHQMGFLNFAWQRSYWDRHARQDDDVRGMIQYVLDNPVRKGLCKCWED